MVKFTVKDAFAERPLRGSPNPRSFLPGPFCKGVFCYLERSRMKSALYPAMRIVALASERTRNLRALTVLDWLAGVLLRWHTRGV